MFRNALSRAQMAIKPVLTRNVTTSSKLLSKASTETDEQFDQRYEKFFNQKDLDGWDIRRGLTDLWGHDLVPEPTILAAALRACKRVNDYALAVRLLEAVKDKCGGKESEIYPWVIQELRPTLTDLGISTPEEMGYDKPELYTQSVFDM
ncbi:cytochrome c oxidase subunit 5A, mitochondrial-like [Anthonomus grandis grandis]|uniref:cytochrome c oxidase subunit 5A, mitochondrial-like n=1 Tax=Anthonomus grandis grandis TaxID=2921223 RepID=UPI002165B89D|nr:cytochrome c oxidase subunit 5A, mitochondrial-like [Anthonomus grandis grandis]